MVDNLQRHRLLTSRLDIPSIVDGVTTSLEGLETSGVAPDAPPLPQFAAGELINGRYEVNRILGQGGMGVVYQVRDRMFQLRPTALKTMRRLSDGEWLDLFRSEFLVLSELATPCLQRKSPLFLCLHPQRLHQPMQIVRMQAEDLRGLAVAAAGILERPADELFLDLPDHFVKLRA